MKTTKKSEFIISRHTPSDFSFQGLMDHLGLASGNDFYSFSASASKSFQAHEDEQYEFAYKLRKIKRKPLSIKAVENRQSSQY